MKKPAHQWATRLHRAIRREDRPGGALADDPRAEAFELRFEDGRRGWARLGLARQEVDGVGATDPDLPHAVRCWLAARGQRQLDLHEESGALLATGPFTLDDLGDGPARMAPVRVITLAPSNAEMVHALGAFDRVVACEDSSDYPPAVRDVTRLGPDLDPDLDRVAELTPDLVVSSLSVPGMERIVTGLRARGLRQVVLAPRSIDEVMDDARRVARRLHDPAAGERVGEQMEAERQALLAARPPTPVRVYLEWWPRPMYTPGRDCFSNELMALAGGENVFGDRPGSSVEISAADLRRADPDLCFVSWCGVAEAKLDPENLRGRPGLEGLRAGREGAVHALDEAFAGRPGPRMLEAARRMARVISGR